MYIFPPAAASGDIVAHILPQVTVKNLPVSAGDALDAWNIVNSTSAAVFIARSKVSGSSSPDLCILLPKQCENDPSNCQIQNLWFITKEDDSYIATNGSACPIVPQDSIKAAADICKKNNCGVCISSTKALSKYTNGEESHATPT